MHSDSQAGRGGYRVVIFDFDGTLGDTRRNIILTMQQTLAHEGLPVAAEEAIAATIGLPLEKGFSVLYPQLTEAEVAQCAATYREIFERNRAALVPGLFPHAQEMLSVLFDRGLTLTVASSRSSRSLHGFLDDMEIAPFFSYVLGADNVKASKPDPEPVLQTLRDLGFEAREALVVGDMPVDILMGSRAGAATCGVTYGNSTPQNLQEAGADFLIDDLLQLVDIL